MAAREDLASLEAISRRFEDPADRLGRVPGPVRVGGHRELVAVGRRLGRVSARLRGARHARPLRRGLARGAGRGARRRRAPGPLGVRRPRRDCSAADGRPRRHRAAQHRPRSRRRPRARDRLGAAAGRARARRDAAGRAAAAARRPKGRPHETQITIRARDLDAYGRVDPAVLLSYLQEARDAWLGDRVGRGSARRRRLPPSARAATAPVVRCALDAAGRSGVRTRETIAAGGTSWSARDDARGGMRDRAPARAERGRARGARAMSALPTPRSPAIAAQISSRARSTGIVGSSLSARMP